MAWNTSVGGSNRGQIFDVNEYELNEIGSHQGSHEYLSDMLKQGKIMRVVRWVSTILKYGAGVLCWLIVFGLLQNQCIFNITSIVDRLWVKDLHGDLVENVIGDIALHVQRGRCVDRYLYTARYDPSRTDIQGEIRSLTSLVDVATWKLVEVRSVSVTYLDARHRYEVYSFSDDEFIKAVNR